MMNKKVVCPILVCVFVCHTLSASKIVSTEQENSEFSYQTFANLCRQLRERRGEERRERQRGLYGSGARGIERREEGCLCFSSRVVRVVSEKGGVAPWIRFNEEAMASKH